MPGRPLIFVFIPALFIVDRTIGASVPPTHINGKANLATEDVFTLLGTSTHPLNDGGIGAVGGNTLYFQSQNDADYTAAEDDCKTFLSNDATPLYIETKDELDNINRFFQSSDDIGSTYWIGGRFYPRKEVFAWGNGIEFADWVPWDEGYPAGVIPDTRVYIFRNGGPIRFRTALANETYRFICEVKSNM